MKKKVLVLVSVILVLSMLLAACATATEAPAAETEVAATEAPAAATEAPAKEYKLAVVFPGVITDADYNTLAYNAMTAVQETMGIETAYSESVAVADVDRVMREYVDAGYNIIWTHGGQFITQTVELAKLFPDVVFIAEGDANVAEPPANLWFIDRNFQTGYYAIGTIAALASKTGKIGYLGGSTLAFSYQEVHAIQQALADMGSNVQLVINYTGDFNDPTKARQAADAMIADGVDVIMASVNLGVLGVFEAAKAAAPDKKILVTAKYTDKGANYQDNYITSMLYDFTKPLTDIVTKIQAGETGGYYALGFDTGVSIQTPLLNVDETVAAKAQEVINKVMDGTITVVEDSTEVK
ncbi:MAG: BMP family protein [Anaerolineaceae bacterium]|nr:BMP family protein [Anaerolineaceae bacterium]